MRYLALVLASIILLSFPVLTAQASSADLGRVEVFPYQDALLPPERPTTMAGPMAGAPPAPGYDDLSEYFMGTVVVGVILPESNGVTDPNTEDWTPAEQAQVKAETEAGFAWWVAQDSRARLSFVYEYHTSVPTRYEPITHSGPFDEFLWITDVMGNLGYTSGGYFARVRAWVNDLRTSYHTDWTLAVWVVDSSSDADGTFSSGYSGYAYLGGPFFVMTYDNDGYGIDDMDFVAAHELAHVFYATDEYNGIPERSGYLNVLDVESSGCIMHQAMAWCISSGTRGQLGWRDTDGDNIFDILDEPPRTTLTPYSPDPTSDTTPTYFGTGVVVPYPNSNPWGPGNDVTISLIANAQYIVDSGAWLPAQPVDGAFDTGNEAIRFTTFSLSSGLHQISARVINSEGNADITPPYDLLTIDAEMPVSALRLFPPIVNFPILDLSADASDDIGLFDVELWFSFEGSGFSMVSADLVAPWEWNVDTAALNDDGNYSFYTRAMDTAGNHESPPPVPDLAVLVDTVPPWSSLVQPPSMTNQTSFPLTALVGDIGIIRDVELFYRCNSGSWTSFGVLPSPPWSWSIDSTLLCGDGTYEFYTVASDTAGNIEAPPSSPDATVIVDTTPPTSTMQPLPPFTNHSVFSVTADPSDFNGVSSVEIHVERDLLGSSLLATLTSPPWSVSIDTTLLGGDGRYDFYSIATDSAGNVEGMHSLPDASTIVDTAPPTATVAALPSFTRSLEFTVSVTATDLNGVSSVELWVRRGGGAWTLLSAKSSGPWSWTVNVSSLGEGTYNFASLSVDMAGNAESGALAVEATTVVDITPPAISFTYPPEGMWIRLPEIDLSWTGSDQVSGLDEYRITIGGDSWTVPATQMQLVLDSLTDGIHTVDLRAWDRAGNVAMITRSLRVDRAPPELQVTSPPDGGSAQSPVAVGWQGSDATSGIAGYEYSMDGGEFVDVDDAVATVLDLGEGIHTITVRARDVAGNEREVAVSFSVPPPALSQNLSVFLITLVLLAVVLTLILAMLMRRRRRKEEEPPSPPDD